MRTKTVLLFLSAIISFAFILSPTSVFVVTGKTWYFHSLDDDHIQFTLSKPDAVGNGSFTWIVGINITDKREGKYTLKNNILTLNYFWAGVKTLTKIYRIENETKTGFLMVEQQAGVNESAKAFLFTASQ
jgi:hypothetical protein